MKFDYIDSSALVKLVVAEPESDALRGYLRRFPEEAMVGLVSSRLAQSELLRAAARRSPETVEKSRSVLRGVHLVGVTESVCQQADVLQPAPLRTLDAIHLATALSEKRVLRHVITYDDRLAEGCRQAGLQVVRPGSG